MNWIVVILALLLAGGGGYLSYLGLDINQVEHGWAQMIGGAVLVSGAVVTLGLAGIMFKLDGVRKAFRQGNKSFEKNPAKLREPDPAKMLLPETASEPMPHPAPLPRPIGAASRTLATAGLATAGLATTVALAAGAAALVTRPSEAAEPEADVDRPPHLPEYDLAPPLASEPEWNEAEAVVDSGQLEPSPVQATSIDQDIAAIVASRQDKPAPGTEPDLLDGDWLEKALAGSAEDILPAPAAPEPAAPHNGRFVAEAAAWPEAEVPAKARLETLAAIEPPVHVQDNSLEEEVAREMSYFKAQSGEAAQVEAPLAPAPDALPAAAASLVVGKYQSGGINYIMYADGAIDADNGTSLTHFKSMAELKAFLAPGVDSE